MPIPHSSKIKIALWQELEQAEGTGEAQAQDIIKRLAQRFQLTQTEREQRNLGGNKTFNNRVHAAVEWSRKKGWIEPPQVSGRSIWKLTLEGRQSVPIYFLVSPPHSHEEIE